jgi:hypothetical protein
MNLQLNTWQKEVISNWSITYSGILKWKWVELNDELKNTTTLDFINNEELKRSILSLHPNNYEEIIHSTKLFKTVEETTIFKLLKEPKSFGYSINEAEELVKLYISSYWSFLCK